MINFSLLRSATLSSALLVGLAGPGLAQSPAKDELARCQALYGQWTRYNGTSAYGKMLNADVAAEECRKGNTTAGIADLKRMLERSNIPLPASETARAP
jgi:hypothetical protein